MKLYEEMLAKALADMQCTGDEAELERVVESRCYAALQAIKEALDDETMDDRECFLRIERIIRIYEEMGSGGGWRHDFG